MLYVFAIAVPLALVTASAVWAATTGGQPPAGVDAAAPDARAAAPNPDCTLVVPPDP